jgi:hypothetical protein
MLPESYFTAALLLLYCCVTAAEMEGERQQQSTCCPKVGIYLLNNRKKQGARDHFMRMFLFRYTKSFYRSPTLVLKWYASWYVIYQMAPLGVTTQIAVSFFQRQVERTRLKKATTI